MCALLRPKPPVPVTTIDRSLGETPVVARINGEVVVREAGRLAFERLQNRLQRRGAGASRAAGEWPAHFVAYDLLRLSETDTTGWPYRRRRAVLEPVFASRRLSAPWGAVPVDHPPGHRA